MPCRIVRRSNWVSRMILETEYWRTRYAVKDRALGQLVSDFNPIMATLTFEDQHLPPDNSGDKKFIRKYLKRFERAFLSGGCLDFRYFISSDYGDKYGRLHYHAIFWGGETNHMKNIVRSVWDLGYVDTGENSRYKQKHFGVATKDAFRYVANYVTQKSESNHARDDGWFNESDTREPIFSLQSRKPPLGKAYVQLQAQHLINKGYGLIGYENPHDPQHLIQFQPFFEAGKVIYTNPITNKSHTKSSKVLLDGTMRKAFTEHFGKDLRTQDQRMAEAAFWATLDNYLPHEEYQRKVAHARHVFESEMKAITKGRQGSGF